MDRSQYVHYSQRGDRPGAGGSAAAPPRREALLLFALGSGALPAAVSLVAAVPRLPAEPSGDTGSGIGAADLCGSIRNDAPFAPSRASSRWRGASRRDRRGDGGAADPYAVRRSQRSLAGGSRGPGGRSAVAAIPAAAELALRASAGGARLSGGCHGNALCPGHCTPQDLSAVVPRRDGTGAYSRP